MTIVPGKKGINTSVFISEKDFAGNICQNLIIPKVKIMIIPKIVAIEIIVILRNLLLILYAENVKNPDVKEAIKYPMIKPPVGLCNIIWIPAFPEKTGKPKQPNTI